MLTHKKIIILLATVFFSLFGMVKSSQAASYYVSPSGSAVWSQCTNINTPCSLDTANSSAAAGDTVNLTAGNYPESIIINVSGAPENRITFVGNGNVTINQVTLTNADYITLSNLTIGNTGNPHWSSNLYIDVNSSYTIVTGCVIDGGYGEGNIGISMYGDHGTVTGTTITHIQDATAINLGYPGGTSSYNTFTQSTVRDTKDADAFRFFGNNNEISYNEITGNVIATGENHSDFVQTFSDTEENKDNWGTSNILIDSNYVHDSECQVFYMSNAGGAIMGGYTFRNNVFYNILYMGQAVGRITNVNFYNNVFHKVGLDSTFAIYLGGTSTGEIKNNVFLECGYIPSANYFGWYQLGSETTYSKSNNYVGGTSYTTKDIVETGVINGGNPKFVDEVNQDYRLQSDSPLKDAGITVASFNIDKDSVARPTGSAWDIGAYEYIDATDTTPPAAPTGLSVN